MYHAIVGTGMGTDNRESSGWTQLVNRLPDIGKSFSDIGKFDDLLITENHLQISVISFIDIGKCRINVHLTLHICI